MADVIASSGLKFHQYADDTQLYISFTANNFTTGLKALEECTLTLKEWLAYNYLQLNPSKSEALLIDTKQQTMKMGQLPTVTIAGECIKLSTNIKNLGVWLDSSLTLNHHVTQQCNSCYYHIRQFKHIRPFLTDSVAKMVSQAIVFSRLDYCNSLLYNTSQSNLHKQRVQNSLARVIAQTPRYGSITNAKKSLHWLLVDSR